MALSAGASRHRCRATVLAARRPGRHRARRVGDRPGTVVDVRSDWADEPPPRRDDRHAAGQRDAQGRAPGPRQLQGAGRRRRAATAASRSARRRSAQGEEVVAVPRRPRPRRCRTCSASARASSACSATPRTGATSVTPPALLAEPGADRARARGDPSRGAMSVRAVRATPSAGRSRAGQGPARRRRASAIASRSASRTSRSRSPSSHEPTHPPTMLRRSAAVVLAACLALGHAAPASAYQTYGIKVGNRVGPGEVEPPAGQVLRHRPRRGRRDGRPVPRRGRARVRHVAGRRPPPRSRRRSPGSPPPNPDDEDNAEHARLPDAPRPRRACSARTSFLIDDVTGEIVETDIFFNSTFPVVGVRRPGEIGQVRPRVDHPPRDRAPVRPRALVARRDGTARRRRPPRDCGRSGDVPDRVLDRRS